MKHPTVNQQESFCENMVRLILFYNRLAIQYLQQASGSHENIHQARLCFKRLRSILRLGKKGIGENTYRTFNAFYRDQSRVLSQLRDLTALIEILPWFIKTRRSKAAAIFLLQIKQEMINQRKQQMADIISGNIKSKVILALEEKTPEIGSWKFTADTSEILCLGAQKVFKNGRQLFKYAMQNPDAHNMHEWRKQVKYFWYHLIILAPLWPELMTSWAGEVQILSQWLGKYHDLVMLEHKIMSFSGNMKSQTMIRSLMNSISLRKKQLEQLSLKKGSKIYAESSRSTGNRLKSYFDHEISNH